MSDLKKPTIPGPESGLAPGHESMLARGHASVSTFSYTYAWAFPLLLTVAVILSVVVVGLSLGVKAGPIGAALAARMACGVSATLYSVFFIFAIVAFNTLMFKCGEPETAMLATVVTSILGVVGLAVCLRYSDAYLGPDSMKSYLEDSAFRLTGVRTITAAFDGFAIWASALVVATSCIIIKHEVKKPDQLSEQLRGSTLLIYIGAALLVAGVSEISALHKWPAHDHTMSQQAAVALSKQAVQDIEDTATAISSAVGTVFSLVLATAYLPLGIVLRQRAYRVLPYERAESWLAVHGFALQPTQQLAKILMILSPLVAGGPISYLVSLLTNR